jgi:6-phosphogluconolactonase
VLNSADEVWVIASGAEKAKAVSAALSGADRHEIPAAGVRGTRATVWLLDQDAASALAIHGD